MEIILITGFVALIALNAYASRQCYRDTFSSTGQRLAQIAFIWVVPFIGAALALHLLRSETEKSLGTYRDEPNMGDEFAAYGQLNSQGYISSIGDNAHSVGDSDASPN
jgi:preprotein translocase subunit SecG